MAVYFSDMAVSGRYAGGNGCDIDVFVAKAAQLLTAGGHCPEIIAVAGNKHDAAAQPLEHRQGRVGADFTGQHDDDLVDVAQGLDEGERLVRIRWYRVKLAPGDFGKAVVGGFLHHIAKARPTGA